MKGALDGMRTGPSTGLGQEHHELWYEGRPRRQDPAQQRSRRRGVSARKPDPESPTMRACCLP